MKRYMGMLFILAVLAVMPVKSFAVIDAEVFGGYVFNGEADGIEGGKATDVKGPSYGFRGHFNGDVVLFDVGLGLYWQQTNLDFSNSTYDYENKISSLGFDAYVKLDLPGIPLKPYVRGGLGIRDRFEVDAKSSSMGNFTLDNKENFNSYYYGIGAAFTVLPLPGIDVQVFGEYIYTSYKDESSNNGDVKSKTHAINLGALVAI